MGMMVVASIAVALPSAVLAWVIYLGLNKKVNRDLAAIVSAAFGMVLWAFAVIPTLNGLIYLSTTTYLDVKPPSYFLEDLRLPADHVSDFCYQLSPLRTSIRADFEMPRRDFLDWMESRGWDVQQFETRSGSIELTGGNHKADFSNLLSTSVCSVRESHQNATIWKLTIGMYGKHRVIQNGLLVYRRDDEFLTFLYDLETGRVYFNCYIPDH